MPITICSGKRKSKVANEVSDKGDCASKLLYYYGVRDHFLCSRIPGKHPVPSHLIITPASEVELNVFRDNWSGIGKKMVFADKAYQDTAMLAQMLSIGSEVLSPIKYPRGVPERIKQMSKAADDLFSGAISSIRQPIESLFFGLSRNLTVKEPRKFVLQTDYSYIFSTNLRLFLCKNLFQLLIRIIYQFRSK